MARVQRSDGGRPVPRPWLCALLRRHKPISVTFNEHVFSYETNSTEWCEVAMLMCERCYIIIETAGEAQ